VLIESCLSLVHLLIYFFLSQVSYKIFSCVLFAFLMTLQFALIQEICFFFCTFIQLKLEFWLWYEHMITLAHNSALFV